MGLIHGSCQIESISNFIERFSYTTSGVLMVIMSLYSDAFFNSVKIIEMACTLSLAIYALKELII